MFAHPTDHSQNMLIAIQGFTVYKLNTLQIQMVGYLIISGKKWQFEHHKIAFIKKERVQDYKSINVFTRRFNISLYSIVL